MIRTRSLASRLVVTSLLFAATAARAQYSPTSPESLPNNYPPPLPDRRGPAPKLAFTIAGEIELAGPLGERSAWTEAGEVYVPNASGVARVAPALDAQPREMPPAASADDPTEGWRVSPGGLRRYRTTLEGIVEAQRRRTPRSRWHRAWTIVAPNATPAPPLLIGPRLCYAGLDDRVTCVRASNGHRLWSIDLGDRISRPIAAWPARAAASVRPSRRDRSVEGEVLLVVPDNGASIVALDAYDGTKIAAYDLPAAKNRFASAPFTFPGGRIAVVRKGYAIDEVALTLLDLVPVSPAKPPAAVPYNAGSPSSPPTPGR